MSTSILVDFEIGETKTDQQLIPNAEISTSKAKDADMTTSSQKTTKDRWKTVFRRFGITWFVLAAIGQIGFIVFILSYYGPRTASGNFAAWNDKALIDGHKPGDDMGNFMFITHVLLAAVMTFGGLMQLIPGIRNRYRALHRWNGRVFLGLACFLALGGLWLGWVRGTRLSLESGLAVSFNSVLILAFGVPTLLLAMRRRIADHQRWAMRTFMVANGVWFFRVGIMGWVLVNQSPRWMNNTLSGPADIALSIGSYLIPLLGLELYYSAQKSSSNLYRATAFAVLVGLTLFMGVGIAGTMLIMWPGDLSA